jgi:hypothetical protein
VVIFAWLILNLKFGEKLAIIFWWMEVGGISRKILNFIFLIISGQLAELAEPIKKLAPLTVTELLRGQDIPPTSAGYP